MIQVVGEAGGQRLAGAQLERPGAVITKLSFHGWNGAAQAGQAMQLVEHPGKGGFAALMRSGNRDNWLWII